MTNLEIAFDTASRRILDYILYIEGEGTRDNATRYAKKNDATIAAFRLLEEWRATGKFCCIDIKSDYDYVWDIQWAFADDSNHEMHSIGYSLEFLPLAIFRSAQEAMAMLEEREDE